MRNVNTIEGLVDIFRSIASRHQMINDFGAGPSYNIGQSRSMQYPYLWVEFVPSTVTMQASSIMMATYTFDCYVMDRINKGDDNFVTTISDCDAIINTILVEFSKSAYYRERQMNFYGDVVKQPAQESSDDNANGWIFTINVRMPIRWSSCELPIDPICEDC